MKSMMPSGPRRCRRALVVIAGAAAAILASLIPADASASTYIWRANAPNTSWTNPANWEHVAGSGPLGAGYPNGVGDVASFSRMYGLPVAVVFGNTTLTVGAINITAPNSVSIVAGAGGSFVLDNGSAGPVELSVRGGSRATHLVDVPMQLRSNLVVHVNDGARLRLAAIGEANGPYGVSKYGAGGVLELFRPNSFTGRTIVSEGSLEAIGFAGGPGVSGDLVVGDGFGAYGSANVYTRGVNQIPDTGRVSVMSDGLLQLGDAERFARLVIYDGAVETRQASATLSLSELHMTGGALFAALGSRIDLEGDVTAMSSSVSGPAVISTPTSAPFGQLNLVGTRTFTITRGPAEVDLEIVAPISGTAGSGVVKNGAGVLRLSGRATNTFAGETRVEEGRLDLNGADVVLPGNLRVGGGTGSATVEVLRSGNVISDVALVTVGARGVLRTAGGDEQIQSLEVNDGGEVRLGEQADTRLTMMTLVLRGGRLALLRGSAVIPHFRIEASSSATQPAVITGTGGLGLVTTTELPLVAADGPLAVDVRIEVPVAGSGAEGLLKRGSGTVLLARDNRIGGRTRIAEGTLLMNGSQPAAAIRLEGGVLGGTGTVGSIAAPEGRLSPGLSPGRLRSGALTLGSGTSFVAEVGGVAAGVDYDQLAVTGAVDLGGATLALTVTGSLPPDASLTLIENDGTDPVVGTFAGLAEGATLAVDGREFTVSYRGGDGNDVVLASVGRVTYYLAEGATGDFFDNDVLIANPNPEPAPVTLTFLLEGGRTVVERRTVPAEGRLTVAVDAIAGLEAAAASVEVVSENRRPLVVERSMFWDAEGYGGHTANAVAQAERRWIFAEGFQGFFDTFLLIANANAEATTATVTFLVEGAAPVVKTVEVGAQARRTVYAGAYPELRGRAFGMVVEATRPVIAERAMYFASGGGRQWAGGHVNTGIVAPARAWFHAEGATGAFFQTFILLSNPNTTAATVTLRFLLDTGAVIERRKTVAAQGRLTVNPAAEGDARLANAAVSTVVEADVPIVSERSMYWAGEAAPFGEGHNSTGVTSLGLRWGLAEGRVGGTRGYDTYILLANPGAEAAQVRVTYLRENGAPVARTYTVPATSRYNVDVRTAVPELVDSRFGARVEVLNGVPIVVERSVYWNAGGVTWAGGSNALGTPLP